MKKLLLLMAGLLTALSSFSQSAQQLITAHNFTNLAAINAVANPIRGNLAFNLDNDLLYYYDGTNWVPISNGAATSGWSLSGNVAQPIDFIGTTNEQDLVFKVYNNERWRMKTNGNLYSPT